MNLRSAHSYWVLHTPLLYTYSNLLQDIKTEVAVIGGGISGALTAYALVKAGCRVTIISQHHIGLRSTAASTALLQYEIDTPLHKLIQKAGEEVAEKSYLLCHDSIDELEKIHLSLGLKNIFQRRKSLQLASRMKDVADLEKEYELRSKIGIDLAFLNREQVNKNFVFDAPAALYSKQGAQTDAYQLTQQLINWCARQGAQVFDKTEIKSIICNRHNVELKTDAGYCIDAKYAVMATGYECTKWLELNVARLHSTYVITSEPFAKKELWKDECLIWETVHPYTYMRTTADNRVIIGGKDETFSSANKRDALLNTKSKQLVKAFASKFPHLQFNIEHAWAGTFAETADGLPFIDAAPKMPRVLFALGFGGNGITFSQVAAEIIRDVITGQKNSNKNLFAFDRKVK